MQSSKATRATARAKLVSKPSEGAAVPRYATIITAEERAATVAAKAEKKLDTHLEKVKADVAFERRMARAKMMEVELTQKAKEEQEARDAARKKLVEEQAKEKKEEIDLEKNQIELYKLERAYQEIGHALDKKRESINRVNQSDDGEIPAIESKLTPSQQALIDQVKAIMESEDYDDEIVSELLVKLNAELNSLLENIEYAAQLNTVMQAALRAKMGNLTLQAKKGLKIENNLAVRHSLEEREQIRKSSAAKILTDETMRVYQLEHLQGCIKMLTEYQAENNKPRALPPLPTPLEVLGQGLQGVQGYLQRTSMFRVGKVVPIKTLLSEAKDMLASKVATKSEDIEILISNINATIRNTREKLSNKPSEILKKLWVNDIEKLDAAKIELEGLLRVNIKSETKAIRI